MDKIKRKTFAAREDLIEGMNKVARLRGLSLYGFVNETFEAALKAEDQGMSLQSLMEGLENLKASRETGFILGLESLWYEMTDLAYEKVKEKALKSWFDAGVWLAKSYISNSGHDPFLTFKKRLESFIWNASELDIKETSDEKVSIRVISPRFPESYTFLLTAFLEGALEAFGCKGVSKEVSKGTIRIRAHKT